MAVLKVIDAEGIERDLSAGTDGEGLIVRHEVPGVATAANQATGNTALSAANATLVDILAVLGVISTRLAEIRDNALVTESVIYAIQSADMLPHAFPSKVVKTPVTLSIRKGTGPVTISDGSGVDSILEFDDTLGHHTHVKTFYVANMNQLTYQFSVHNGSQFIEVQAGA